MRQVKLDIESWPLMEPFVITGHTWTHCDVLVVSIIENGVTGRGEATGVYYLDETAESMFQQALAILPKLESGISRDQLQSLLPLGGTRNAIDCALWDIEAKKSDQSIFELTGMAPLPVRTVNTVTIDTPEEMADKAKAITSRQIKVKLDGELPLERISAVCKARPDANIVVDGLQDKVEVLMDERLVPHIYANNDNDAYYTQGFLHAKFRLWQMEFQTYVAAGRLSEIVGPDRIATDRFFRRLGMLEGAEATMKKMANNPALQAAVTSYANGVNAYIKSL